MGGPQLSHSHPRASAVSHVTHFVHSFVLRHLFPKSLVALQIFKIGTLINTLLWVHFSAGRLSHAMGHRVVWFDARRGALVGKECWKGGGECWRLKASSRDFDSPGFLGVWTSGWNRVAWGGVATDSGCSRWKFQLEESFRRKDKFPNWCVCVCICTHMRELEVCTEVAFHGCLAL